MSHPVIVQFAPRFTAAQALGILRAIYGREGTLEALPSERDQNFKVVAPDGAAFVLKIANGTERGEILDFENRAIAHLAGAARNLAVPRLVPTRDGRVMGQVREDGSEAQWARAGAAAEAQWARAGDAETPRPSAGAEAEEQWARASVPATGAPDVRSTRSISATRVQEATSCRRSG
jgi:Ser/Thr protein kinase RdoA (MazF antagonist)